MIWCFYPSSERGRGVRNGKKGVKIEDRGVSASAAFRSRGRSAVLSAGYTSSTLE